MTDTSGDLAAAIASLRADLQGAMEEGVGEAIQFGLENVELTLQLVATREGGGKIGWSVLGINAGATSERTHTITLSLKPTYRKADGSYTTDFTIAVQLRQRPKLGPQPEPGSR